MILEIKEEFVYDIIAGIRVMAKDKFSNVMRIKHLLRYMNYKYSFGFDLGVFQYMKWKDREERLLMILKYLHSGHRNREQIAEQFGISVYQQLSDFAGDMIDSLPESSETGYGIEGIEYMNSFELMRQFNRPFCQFLKERKPCRVIYEQDGEKRSIIGILGLSEDTINRFKKVVVHTEEGELSLDVKDILKLEKI